MKHFKIIFLFLLLFSLLFLLLFFHNNKLEENMASDINLTSSINSEESFRELEELRELRLSVKKGDVEAYKKLGLYFFKSPDPNCYIQFLPYALLMANKYDYTMAYYDVFDCLTSLYWSSFNTSISLDSLDEQTREMALEYLKKAADKGEPNALRDLGWLHLEGKHVKKDTVLGNQLLERRSQENK